METTQAEHFAVLVRAERCPGVPPGWSRDGPAAAPGRGALITGCLPLRRPKGE